MPQSKQDILNNVGQNLISVLVDLEKKRGITGVDVLNVIAGVFWTYLMIHSTPDNIHQNIESARKLLEQGAEEILPQAEDAYWKHYEAMYGVGNS